MISVYVAILVVITTSLMAYISYKYPFNNEKGQVTKAANFFGVLVIITILGGIAIAFYAYNDSVQTGIDKRNLNGNISDLSKRANLQTEQLRSLGYTTDFVKG